MSNNPLDRVNDCARAVINLGLPLNVKLSEQTEFEKEVVFDFFRSCWDAREQLQDVSGFSEHFTEEEMEQAKEDAWNSGYYEGYADGEQNVE